MTDETEMETTSLVQRIVLLGLAQCAVLNREPVRLDEVRRTCNDRFDDVAGRLSEADVTRALNELAASSLVDERITGGRSAVGKGRPSYVLAIDADRVFEELADDRQVRPLVERFRTEG